MPASTSRSSTLSSSSIVDPTQVRCAIASSPVSRLMRLTMIDRLFAGGSAGPVGDRYVIRIERNEFGDRPFELSCRFIDFRRERTRMRRRAVFA